MKLRFTALLAAAALLAGCASQPTENCRETDAAPAKESAAITPATEPVTACAGDTCAAPITGTSTQNRASNIRVSYIEFLVPPERATAVSLMLLDESKTEADDDDDDAGRTYDALMKSAKSGETELQLTGMILMHGTSSTLKSATLLRYPESHSQPQFVGPPSPEKPQPPEDSAKDKPVATDATAPAPTPAKEPTGPGVIIPGWPQDFVEREVGFVLEVLPTVAENGEACYLDIKPKRTTCDVAPGQQSADPTRCPEPPQFSISETVTMLTVANGEPTFFATIPPAPEAKDRRTRVVFIRADW